MHLEGTLDQFSLRELIEMILYSSVGGVLEVGAADGKGRIFFSDGQPYHATDGDSRGFAAVCTMFQRSAEPFRFIAGEVAPDETLALDPLDMIERAEQQAQLWGRVRPRIPNASWVPVLCSTTDAEHIHISENVWPVLSAVDGQRSVARIAESLSVAELDVCLALVSLLDQGLISIRQPLPRHLEPRSSGATPARAAPSGGFFERLIAGIPALDNGAPQPASELTSDGDRRPARRP